MSPPPDNLLKYLSEQSLLTENHLYGDVLEDIPWQVIVNLWNEEAALRFAHNVAITSHSCNQAFALRYLPLPML